MPKHELPSLPLPQSQWNRLVELLDLPPSQTRIVELIMRNQSNKQIAAAMSIKVPTLREYLKRIYRRIQVGDRVELILKLFAMSHEHTHG